MKKLLINFPENVSSALGYTLLHSLWQGALIVLMFWLLSLGIKQARHRYNLAIGGFTLLLAISVLTFFYLYEPAVSISLAEAESFLVAETLWLDDSLAAKQSLGESLLGFINTHIDQMAFLWALGVIFLVARMSLGLLFIEKLKRSSFPVINGPVQTLMEQLRQRVGIPGPVHLAETAEITTPVTVGWLKPIVLFPVGLLSGLSVQHVEAILAHELAHIKRYDYLVNILQSFGEILFFFNPFVWFLSSQIRTERENCCDDIAMEICGNRLVLAKALVEVADYSVPFAMAFGKRSDSLLTRVKRIAGVSPSGYFSPANVLGVLFVMSLFLGGVVYAKEEILEASEFEEEEISQEMAGQTQPVEGVTLRSVAETDTLDTRMEKLHKEIEALSAEIQKHSEKISGISTRMQDSHLKEIDKLAREISAKAEKIETPAIQQQELAIQQMQLDLESRKLNRRTDLGEKEKEKLLRELEEKGKKLEKSLNANTSQMEELQAQISVLQEKISREQAPLAELQEEISRHHTPIDSLSRIIQLKSDEIRVLAEKKRIAMEKSMNDFMYALGSAGLISGKEDMILRVTGEELMMNGIVKSRADYEKVWGLLNKYFVDKHYIEEKYLEARDFSIIRKGGKLSWRFRNGRSSYMNNWSTD